MKYFSAEYHLVLYIQAKGNFVFRKKYIEYKYNTNYSKLKSAIKITISIIQENLSKLHLRYNKDSFFKLKNN